uniref:Uncharacterized protein n=1 Tax=Arundo donax TaxID=35708 RepID=A0A0A9CD87_ARUDO
MPFKEIHNESTVILWPLPMKMTEWKPWPPPHFLVRRQKCCDQAFGSSRRLPPWPTQGHQVVCWLLDKQLKAPWPPPEEEILVCLLDIEGTTVVIFGIHNWLQEVLTSLQGNLCSKDQKQVTTTRLIKLKPWSLSLRSATKSRLLGTRAKFRTRAIPIMVKLNAKESLLLELSWAEHFCTYCWNYRVQRHKCLLLFRNDSQTESGWQCERDLQLIVLALMPWCGNCEAKELRQLDTLPTQVILMSYMLGEMESDRSIGLDGLHQDVLSEKLQLIIVKGQLVVEKKFTIFMLIQAVQFKLWSSFVQPMLQPWPPPQRKLHMFKEYVNWVLVKLRRKGFLATGIEGLQLFGEPYEISSCFRISPEVHMPKLLTEFWLQSPVVVGDICYLRSCAGTHWKYLRNMQLFCGDRGLDNVSFVQKEDSTICEHLSNTQLQILGTVHTIVITVQTMANWKKIKDFVTLLVPNEYSLTQEMASNTMVLHKHVEDKVVQAYNIAALGLRKRMTVQWKRTGVIVCTKELPMVWDPGGIKFFVGPIASAWGQAEFQGGKNVTYGGGPLESCRPDSWAGPRPTSREAICYKRNRAAIAWGRDEQQKRRLRPRLSSSPLLSLPQILFL